LLLDSRVTPLFVIALAPSCRNRRTPQRLYHTQMGQKRNILILASCVFPAMTGIPMCTGERTDEIGPVAAINDGAGSRRSSAKIDVLPGYPVHNCLGTERWASANDLGIANSPSYDQILRTLKDIERLTI
jgi:hypothetical protein